MSSSPSKTLFLPFALLAALVLTAGDCQPADDDDSTVPPVGRVSIAGGQSFDSIQEAIDAASPGASIIVSAGLYEESLSINKPLNISGEGLDRVTVTGDGDGTIVQVDQVQGSLQITGMAFEAPFDELGTVRGFRITDSTEVLLHDTFIGFEPTEDGQCLHGLAGVEVSRSIVTLSSTTIFCIGFNSDAGGTGVLTQTDASLTMVDSEITGVGSFAIKAIDSTLNLSDTLIQGINRPSGAESFERDGTAIHVESGTDEIVLDGVEIINGALAGVFVEGGPAMSVSASSFSQFGYGIIFWGGDRAAAASRTFVATGSTFTDLRSVALWTYASTTVTGSTFELIDTVPVPFAFPEGNGIRVEAPGGDVSISGNVLTGMGGSAIGVYGSNVDGAINSAEVVGNTITAVVAGNGLDLQLIGTAVATDNIIDGVDHAYNASSNPPGSISTGFGLDCFFVDSCTLERNEVSGAEFGNYVIVSSAFTSTDDISRASRNRGFHIQTSQGSFVNPTIVDNQGYGLLGVDSTLQGTGGSITGTRRGPYINDLDGENDPLEEDLQLILGGTGLWNESSGAPAFLSWDAGLFQDNIDGGITIVSGQLQLTNSTLRDNGFYLGPPHGETETCNNGIDDNGDELIDCADPECELGSSCAQSPDAALYVSGNDPLAVNGPTVTGNIIDGANDSFWGVYLSDVPGLDFSDNNVCVGSYAGVYVRTSDGAQLNDNTIGTSGDGSITGCDDLAYTYGLYLTNFDPLDIEEGLAARGNDISPPSVQYGLYFSGLGDLELEGNTITGGSTAGVYATMTLPTGLTSDNDGDGRAEYLGDCDDNDPTVGGNGQAEIEGDSLDNDCDGVADDGTSTLDSDEDGFTIADGDCNDVEASVNPDAEEVVGNFRDDNCDGWADFDADLPEPNLTLDGNNVAATGAGMWLHGATAELLEPAGGDPGNTIAGGTSDGVYLNTWTWSGTPGMTPGALIAGAGTTITAPTATCVEIVGVDASASLTGTTLSDCGQYGVTLANTGWAALSGVQIDNPGLAGVQATAGTITITGGSVIDSSADDGVVVAGSASVTLDGATVTGSVGDGISVTGGSVIAGGLTVASSGGDGVTMSSGSFLGGAGLAVTGSTGSGVEATGGMLSLADSTVSTSGASGLSLSGTAVVSLEELIVDISGEHGIYCDGGAANPGASTVALDPCSATVTNATGEPFEAINGCEIDWSCDLGD